MIDELVQVYLDMSLPIWQNADNPVYHIEYQGTQTAASLHDAIALRNIEKILLKAQSYNSMLNRRRGLTAFLNAKNKTQWEEQLTQRLIAILERVKAESAKELTQ